MKHSSPVRPQECSFSGYELDDQLGYDKRSSRVWENKIYRPQGESGRARVTATLFCPWSSAYTTSSDPGSQFLIFCFQSLGCFDEDSGQARVIDRLVGFQSVSPTGRVLPPAMELRALLDQSLLQDKHPAYQPLERAVYHGDVLGRRKTLTLSDQVLWTAFGDDAQA